MDDLRLILVDPNPAVHAAFTAQFDGFPDVEAVHGLFEELPEYDCMVSAANSFGLMDGGVDLAIVRYFGEEMERRVQHRILRDYLGEQPVGTSFLIETGHPDHPWLAHTPTMRIPMDIARTDAVYRAMWAMLLAVRAHNESGAAPIRTVACPGLGTAAGKVPPMEAARQMAVAYAHFLNPPMSISWPLASARQARVRY